MVPKEKEKGPERKRRTLFLLIGTMDIFSATLIVLGILNALKQLSGK